MSTVCKDFVVVLLTCSMLHSRAQTIQDARDLQTQLFTTKTYMKNIRPISDQSKALEVELTFFLQSIHNLDEVNQKLTTIFDLEIKWFDVNLEWFPEDYGNISGFYISQSSVWKPDIALKNGFTKLKELGGTFMSVSVFADGQVIWLPYEVFDSKCSVDTTYFPLDTQYCSLEFSSWGYSSHDVAIVTGSKTLRLDSYEQNSMWDILSTSVKTSQNTPQETASSLRIDLVLKRKPLYFVMNMVLPLILLSVLDVLTFVLPADSGEKVGFSVTVFLAFAVLLTILSDSLPKTSQSLPILGVYMVCQLVSGTAIAVLTGFQVRLHYRCETQAKMAWMIALVKFTRRLNSKENVVIPVKSTDIVLTDIVDEDSPQKKKQVKEYTNLVGTCGDKQGEIKWSDVTSSLDFVLFWFFLFLVVLYTMILFMFARFQ